MNNFIFASAYTFMLFVSSYVYWKKGRQQGINETVAVMKLFEPEATLRLKNTIESDINVTSTKQ